MADADTDHEPVYPPRWNVAIVALHWATLAAVVVLVATGWNLRGPMVAAAARAPVMQWHASIGVAVLALVVVRLTVRLVVTSPASHAGGRVRRAAATAAQVALYGVLVGLVVTGIVAAAPRPFMPGVQLFGVWPLPRLPGVAPEVVRDAVRVHAVLTWTLFGLVGVHVAAAIYATLVAGERTIFRMLPRWRRRDGSPPSA